MYHFAHHPIPLELTMDENIFFLVDDSKAKLTLEPFILIFVVLVVGVGLGLIALLAEMIFFKRGEEKKTKQKTQRKLRSVLEI
jgi:hypothetical protein